MLGPELTAAAVAPDQRLDVAPPDGPDRLLEDPLARLRDPGRDAIEDGQQRQLLPGGAADDAIEAVPVVGSVLVPLRGREVERRPDSPDVRPPHPAPIAAVDRPDVDAEERSRRHRGGIATGERDKKRRREQRNQAPHRSPASR